jgi:hypothetical protein
MARTRDSSTCGDTADSMVATEESESGNALEAPVGRCGSEALGPLVLDVELELESVEFELVVIVVSDEGSSGSVGVMLEPSVVVLVVVVAVVAEFEVCGWLVNGPANIR